MNLTPEQIAMLQDAVDLEVRTQRTLARARQAAADRVAEHFAGQDKHPTQGADTPPPRIRLAIQFLGKPFRPLEAAWQTQRQLTKQQMKLDAAASAATAPKLRISPANEETRPSHATR